MSGELLCSFAELDVLGEALRIDVRPFPFTIPYFGEAKEDRARLFESAHHSLRERGLIHGSEFAPELVEALQVFAGGQTAVVLVGNSGEVEHACLAAFDGRVGVVAVQEGEAVRFTLTPPDAVVRGLVGQLRPLRPGPGAAVTVPDDRREQDFDDFRVTSSVRGAVSVTAEGILNRTRLGGGYFRVVSRGRGRETPVGSVSWVDNDQGRYAVLRGHGHSVFMPADQALIDRHVTQLLNSTR